MAPGDARDLSARDVLRRYYAVSLAYALAGGFVAGVYPLFLRSRGLSQFEINSLLALYFVVTFLTEVPTGALADTRGRRWSFVVGCLLRCAGFALYFVSPTYVLFLVAEAVDAVGTAFCSGALDAWAVDSLDDTGFTGAKERVFSRAAQLSNFGFMTTAMMGAVAAMGNLAWPWLLGAAGFAVAAWLGSVLREHRSGTGRVRLDAASASIVGRIGLVLRRGVRVRSVYLLSLAEGIILAAWAPYWVEWPLFFKHGYDIGVWTVGSIFCLLTVGHMIGAEIAARPQPKPRAQTLSVLVLGIGALMVGAGSLTNWSAAVLGMLFFMNAGLGAREPLARAWFNEEVTSEERATMFSFRSTMATAGAAIGLLLAGYAADARGIPFRWRIAGAMVLLAIPCYLSVRKRSLLHIKASR